MTPKSEKNYQKTTGERVRVDLIYTVLFISDNAPPTWCPDPPSTGRKPSATAVEAGWQESDLQNGLGAFWVDGRSGCSFRFGAIPTTGGGGKGGEKRGVVTGRVSVQSAKPNFPKSPQTQAAQTSAISGIIIALRSDLSPAGYSLRTTTKVLSNLEKESCREVFCFASFIQYKNLNRI
ncbi:hypothetical protein GWI33_007538 [Rhynchophorus ferrugineus]|uniref:Uncharacterized protein n=1 Tax=Rhynchophorus ferrugineus TaxID=354439 RepID=A0A834IFX8_RHYFE|nr:hypothetical protein GWI33_007538 [Rhynchophorus ferrugineus]